MVNGIELRLKIARAEHLAVLVFPNVAHDAAAIAGTVSVDDQNREISDYVIILCALLQGHVIFCFNLHDTHAFRRDKSHSPDVLLFRQTTSRAAPESIGLLLL